MTRDAAQTTALLHVLARYVVGTATPSIVEEVIPVAYPVYGSGTLPPDQVRALLTTHPEARLRTEDDVREDLTKALTRPDRDDLLVSAVEERRHALVADRQAMLRRDAPVEGAEQRRWLHGIDELATASYDVLTATIYYPLVG